MLFVEDGGVEYGGLRIWDEVSEIGEGKGGRN